MTSGSSEVEAAGAALGWTEASFNCMVKKLERVKRDCGDILGESLLQPNCTSAQNGWVQILAWFSATKQAFSHSLSRTLDHLAVSR